MILELTMDLPEDRNYMGLTRPLGRTLKQAAQLDVASGRGTAMIHAQGSPPSEAPHP